MLEWFTAKAPIRLKLLTAFGAMFCIAAMLAISSLFEQGMWLITGNFIFVAATAAAGLFFRKAIADPYVTTVVRMEALAAGDLTSPIAFTNYEDCVGRMTRAMFTFRDNAAITHKLMEEQASIVTVFSEHLRKLASGDLASRLDIDVPAAFVDLKTNYNHAVEQLETLIGQVKASAAAMSTSSAEIANASGELARRTENVAATIEETSTAVTQIDQRMTNTADAARKTVQRADQVMAVVADGRSLTERTVQSMKNVADSTAGIDSVIEGLDKIAFQTRVLAMNAAVEAGRAGDAGQGFAVVADLVSGLAMRAEEEGGRARKQLTAIQDDIIGAVKSVEKVDEVFSHISTGVVEVHALIGSIADDNAMQATAVSQISASINMMDEATQKNVSMVEETSTATQNLDHEVSALLENSATFVLGSDRKPAKGSTQRPKTRAHTTREFA
jgi:methyl-accepting chemotaxis protein